MELYVEKELTYYSNVRSELIDLIPKDEGNSILEVGAGGGDTLVEIKKRLPKSKVYGLELNELSNSNQTNPLIDKFVIGDVEDIRSMFQGGSFDTVVIGDVLEHLIDPWKLMKDVRFLLKNGGVLIASIPNARHYHLLSSVVVRGTFNYAHHGILDKTHLRFFCKRDIVSLISNGGLDIISIQPVFNYLPVSRLRIFNKTTLGIFEQFIALQYVVIAKKNGD